MEITTDSNGRYTLEILTIDRIGPLSTVTNTSPAAATTPAAAPPAEIVDWNWKKVPEFGYHGTIKWNVEVRNKSSRNIKLVQVTLTTYDSQGKLVSSTSTYVQAIPPGQTRSDSSFADYYRTEESAKIVISAVRFAD